MASSKTGPSQVIDPALWRRFRARAVEQGLTVRELQEQAIREYLERHQNDSLVADARGGHVG